MAQTSLSRPNAYPRSFASQAGTTAPPGAAPAVDPLVDEIDDVEPEGIRGVIDQALHLPSTPRGFMLYLAGLLLVTFGAILHVIVSAEIYEAQVEGYRLQQQLEAVERANGQLLWQIAKESNFLSIQARLQAGGYGPVEKREYVAVVPAEGALLPPAPADGSPGTDDAPAALDAGGAAEPVEPGWTAYLASPESGAAATDGGGWESWWQDAGHRLEGWLQVLAGVAE